MTPFLMLCKILHAEKEMIVIFQPVNLRLPLTEGEKIEESRLPA